MERKATLLCALLAAVLLSLGISAQGNVTTTINATSPVVLVNWTASNNPIFYGGMQVLTATLAGGTGSFTYNFSVYNASGIQEFNAMFNSTSATAYSFAYQQRAVWGPGTFMADVTIRDNLYPASPVTNSLAYIVLSTTTTTTSTSSASSTASTSTSSTSASSTTSSVTSIGNAVNATNSTHLTIPHNGVLAGPVAKATLAYQNGRSRGSVLVRGNAVSFAANRSVFTAVDVGLSVKNLTVNVSITNQTLVPVSYAQMATPVYQFIQINGSIANNTGANIDQYITSAVYNFSVANAWISNQGINNTGIRLFKYNDALSAWNPLPTVLLGSNALYSSYSATSDSFSGYAVGFVTGNGAVTTNSVSNTVVNGGFTYNAYFWGAAISTGGYNSVSATAAASYPIDGNYLVQSATRIATSVFNTVAIGHNTLNSAAYTTNFITSANGNTVNAIIAGIGANVIFGNGKMYTANAAGTAATVLPYTATANSFVVLVYASSGAVMSAFSTNAPGNSVAVNVVSTASSGKDQVVIQTVSLTGAATSYNAMASSSTSSSKSLVAYVFPPYAVNLVDNPTKGNIITANMIAINNKYASGQTINVIGTQSINAIAPTGYHFTAWSASSGNLIIASTSTANTYLTVEGNGILTATYALPTVSITSGPSNAIADVGQYETFAATVTSGNGSPYTYNWIGYNSVTHVAVAGANMLFTSCTLTTNTLNWIVSANEPTNSPITWNVIVTDVGAVTYNSIYSTVYGANTALSSGLLTESNTVMDKNQYSLLTANPSGGSVGAGYSYNWFANTVGSPSCNAANAVGQTTKTYGVTPLATTYYTYNVIDSASTKNVVCSASNSITVYTTPTVTITPVNTIIDQGQYFTLTTATSGGSGTFTPYNFLVWNAVTPSVQMANQLGATTTAAFLTNALWTTNDPVEANVFVTDTGTGAGTLTTPYIFNSVNSIAVVVNSPQLAGLLTESNTIIDNTQYSLLTANPGGGSPVYTVSWFTNGACTAPSFATGTTTLVNPSTGTVTYTYNSVDSATTKNVVCSASNSITIRATPSVTTPIPSNILLDAGQYVVYNTILTGTGSSFTVNLINTGYIVSSLTGRSQTTLAFAANIPAVGTDLFNVVATDMGTTTPFIFNSLFNTITVNSAMAPLVGSLPALPAALNTGTAITFNAQTGPTTTGYGTPPFAYNFIISNTITNSVVAWQLYPNVYTTTNSYLWTIPGNMNGNTLSADVIITDSATSPAVANSIDGGTLTVIGSACITNVAPSSINFGSLNPLASANTNNMITDTNSGGAAAYMYVSGGNWIVTSSQLNGFGISNTSWSINAGTSYATANKLAVGFANTLQLVAASGGSNTVYFGLNIPPAATATAFNQIIIIENSC